MYTAQKSNSHYAPQPYTHQSVFKSLLNCASEMSLSRNATGREFQRHGPATDKLLSPRFCNVFSGTLNIALSIYLLYACLVVSIHLSNILHITLAIGAIANIVLLCVRFTYATSVVSVCTFWPMISLASTTLIRPEPWRIGIATATQTPEF